jgi:hypothetical protein
VVNLPSTPPGTLRLLRRRSGARRALLATTAATIAVAVAGVCIVVGWLPTGADRARAAAGPGLSADDVSAQIAAGSASLASMGPALVVVVLLSAAAAAARLSGLRGASREAESAVLRARGLSRAQVLVMELREAAIIAGTGGAAGWVLGLGVLIALGAGTERGLSTWPVATAASTALGAVVVGATMLAVWRPASTIRARGARAATAASVVLLGTGVVVVLTQLGTALTRGVDPIVVVAPSVVLLAAAFTSVAAFAGFAALADRSSGLGPALVPSLPTRQLARRLPVYAVVVALVALTAAQAVFAAAYDGTWTRTAEVSAALRTGADLRADLAGDPVTPQLVADTAEVAGVDDAAAALIAAVEFGGTDAGIVALPAAAAASVIPRATGLDTRALTEALTSRPATVTIEPLAMDGDRVRLAATLDTERVALAERVGLSIVVLDARGTPATIRLDALSLDRASGAGGGIRIVAETDLPSAAGPWRLLAVTASLRAGAGTAAVEISLSPTGSIPAEGTGVLSADSGTVVLWRGEHPIEGPPPVAAAMSAPLAERLGAGVGDTLEFRYAGAGRRGEIVVAAVVPVVPGAAEPDAVFVPLEELTLSMLQRGTSIIAPGSVWASGTPDAATALQSMVDGQVTTARPGVAATVAGSLVAGWWIATAATVVLAVVGVIAALQTLSTARRGEVAALRALGVPARAQAKARMLELAAVGAGALLLGVGTGAVAAALTVPRLVDAVAAQVGAATPAIAGIPLVAALAALAVGLGGAAAWTARDVRRLASRATVGEDAR